MLGRVIGVCAVLLAAFGCSADASANKTSGAAAAVGFGVGAAAVYRATTGGCWAECRPGLVCDRASGTCVPLEPDNTPAGLVPSAVSSGPASTPDDPCRGLCLRGEHCVVKDGVSDCVRDGITIK